MAGFGVIGVELPDYTNGQTQSSITLNTRFIIFQYTIFDTQLPVSLRNRKYFTYSTTYILLKDSLQFFMIVYSIPTDPYENGTNNFKQLLGKHKYYPVPCSTVFLFINQPT